MKDKSCLNCKNLVDGEPIEFARGRYIIQNCKLTDLPIVPQECKLKCEDWEPMVK